jgi:hypothetical protein
MIRFLQKLDLTLIFRLLMGVALALVGYQTSDYLAGTFGLFMIVYSIYAAKYKIGCGYSNCDYTPSKVTKTKVEEIDFTEIK